MILIQNIVREDRTLFFVNYLIEKFFMIIFHLIIFILISVNFYYLIKLEVRNYLYFLYLNSLVVKKIINQLNNKKISCTDLNILNLFILLHC